MRTLRLAILDMYKGTPNQGMRCIMEIADRYQPELEWDWFDVRSKAELPAMEDYDLFISSGGPGSPHEGDGVWDTRYFELLKQIREHNKQAGGSKKYVFFICHSFQLACRFFKVGSVTRRQSMSFGTFPVHLTDAALSDPVFRALPNPFYAADFRDWQLIEPDMDRLEELGAEILAMEKIRPHIPYERAIMAIRFSNEMLAVQFHPEADPSGMLRHMQTTERMVQVVNTYGKKKYEQMIKDLSHPDKIKLTHDTVIPAWLERSIRALQGELAFAW